MKRKMVVQDPTYAESVIQVKPKNSETELLPVSHVKRKIWPFLVLYVSSPHGYDFHDGVVYLFHYGGIHTRQQDEIQT